MIPLAERLRPATLEDFIGQAHLVGSQGPLRRALEQKKIHSMILWGPPGVGKTTLARILAEKSDRPFIALSAINSGVKEVREAIDQAEKQRFFDRQGPILFIDEIHRFSKSQQDALLGAVEKGVVTLIGATTENPSFEVIPALLSRCQVYVLKGLEEEDLKEMLHRALDRDEQTARLEVNIAEYEALLLHSSGDGRRLYNCLEIVLQSQDPDQPITVTNELVHAVLQEKRALYDKTGEQHYDVISAFIKSIRGSDPNATLYYLARMLDAGEDIKFIARRMVISASEDVGLANPNALLMATTCFQAIQMIGMPEARIILSEAAIYLATSPKSNSAYLAIDKALSLVKQRPNDQVPLHLRNAPTRLMKDLGYGKEYKYAHDHPGNFVQVDFMPESLGGATLFEPGRNAQEESIRERLRKWWKDKYDY